jgi:hypothetical protein
MDNLETQEKEQQRLDAEEEQRQIRSMLDQLPDPDNPTGYGELSMLGEVERERYGVEEDQGDLPEELTHEVPTSTGNYFNPDPNSFDPLEPKRKQVAQPIAISLNEE